MVEQPLVQPADLEGFPGAPFPAGVVTAAGGQVRAECEWHIAPTITETVTVETGRSTVALLPSLHVVNVTAIRDEDGKVLDGWRVTKNTGVLTRKAGWPEVIEVDLEHGYPSCPPELLPVVAQRAQRVKAGIVTQENIGARSVSFRAEPFTASVDVVARYKLPPRP